MHACIMYVCMYACVNVCVYACMYDIRHDMQITCTPYIAKHILYLYLCRVYIRS